MYRELIEFKNIALSNDLLESVNDEPNLYDLKVVFDDDTKLVRVENNVNSKKMFNSTYVYDSSRSMTMLNHFEKAALSLQKQFNPELTLEIGSNSGIFIKHFPSDKDPIFQLDDGNNFYKLENHRLLLYFCTRIYKIESFFLPTKKSSINVVLIYRA